MSTSLRQLTNDNFKAFAEFVAAPSAPHEYCEAAMKRLMANHLAPYVIDVVSPPWNFRAKNGVKMVDFPDDASKQRYADAWEEYERACAYILEKEIPGGRHTLRQHFPLPSP